jgi:hypothetical protein
MRKEHPSAIQLAIMVTGSLLTIPLIATLAVWADAHAAGEAERDGAEIAAGIGIVAAWLVGGIVALARPTSAALVFLAAAIAGVVGGRDAPWRESMEFTSALSILFAIACLIAWWRESHAQG